MRANVTSFAQLLLDALPPECYTAGSTSEAGASRSPGTSVKAVVSNL